MGMYALAACSSRVVASSRAASVLSEATKPVQCCNANAESR